MVNVGVIGCGKIAQVRHLPEYAANPNVRIVGLFDRSHDRAQQLAVQYGAKAYDTAEELLADPDIDAVSICVANAAHAEYTIAALQAGKHVLCEKPMATTIEDCERMVAVAREQGKKLMIGQNQRLAAAHVKARELVEQGAIGRVIAFRTTFGHGGPETWSVNPGKGTWFFDRSKSAMGALADLGVHKTDLIQYLLGQRIVAVTARALTLDKTDVNGDPIGVDDNAFAIYEMDGGTVGTMTASWTYYGAEDNSTILYGTEGILRIYDDPDISIKAVMRDGTEVDYRLDRIQTNDAGGQTSSGIIDAFVKSIVDDEKPLIDGADVLDAMRAVFACVESSQQGRRIEINK